ncbi:AT-rich interactive domain-containing protein 2-like isoform X2 [Macadamia integrifolia]|nr:AT-rich interactive domain-containing protein 2-like isoform X2 [Macadamia integrifolia]XP_042477481.1 AT-rich interactive domain-containing protein 2-like isoform X2 [Macadamia integrifolia]XP_042477482.1 AT-rich interactive domain-containing protein 2-like isoform X2 [Macadamia integrifolia]
MAGWSILADGSGLKCVEILGNLQSNSLCLDLDASLKGSLSGCRDKFRCLFAQILTVFLKEISVGEELRTLPAMLGDGCCVDLFKLYWVVRRKGGYDNVCKNRLWASVAEESGFGLRFASSLKLVYVKYLGTLDRWLQRIFKDKGAREVLSASGENLGVLPAELRTEFQGMLSELSDQMKIDGGRVKLGSEKKELLLPDSDCMHEVHNAMHVDGGKDSVDDDDEVVILDSADVKKDIFSRKRKRECSFSDMLNWVLWAAKKPCDPAVGTVPEWPQWKSHEGNEFWLQALLAREALLTRRICSTDAHSIFQKKQKMHPSMYEDPIGGNHQSTGRLRCSQRILSLKSSLLRTPSKSASATRNNPKMNFTPHSAVLENIADRVGVPGDGYLRKHVGVGRIFQVEVPDWTGIPSESDSKWLGTRVWPLEAGEHFMLIERDPIGKGRQDSCDCQRPGSVKCVRFHIAEKRMRLKVELGSAFHHWKFNCMGEEVSLSWTEEEEKRFKTIVRLNPPSLDKCFWDEIYKCFPNKKRRDLLTYYFNAFLLQRRGYQNRATPNTIDSDDDESEFGSISSGFGYEVVKVADSNTALCVQSEQWVDLE